MHIPGSDTQVFPHRPVARLEVRWRCLLTQGTMLVLLGMLAIALPVVTTLAIDLVIGMLLLVSGVWRAIAHLRSNDSQGFGWYFAIAILAILLGTAILQVPFAGIRTLTALLFTYFVFEGVAKILFALDLRVHAHGWGWPLVTGALDLSLAVLILAGWPSTAAWALGLLVGINMMFFGVALIVISLAARHVREGDLHEITREHRYTGEKESSAAAAGRDATRRASAS